MLAIRLAQGYLYANALLYLYVALRTTLKPAGTAAQAGFLSLSERGRAEYLVVYGGLQLGLAALFFLLARGPAHVRLGLLVAVGFYGPVVAYRLGAALRYRLLPGSALGTLALEGVLLGAASWLYYHTR